MAKRMYGSTANIDEVNAHTDELVEDIVNNYVADDTSSDSIGLELNLKSLGIIIGIGIAVIGLVASILFFYNIKYDANNGSKTSTEAVTNFVDNILSDNKAMVSYVPRAIRSHSTLVDDGYISLYKQYASDYGMNITGTDILEETKVAPEAYSKYEDAIVNLYKDKVAVKDASLITAKISFLSKTTIPGAEGGYFEEYFVAIKSGAKWYVVPGLVHYLDLAPTDKIVATTPQNDSANSDTSEVATEYIEDSEVESDAESDTNDDTTELAKTDESDGDIPEIIYRQEIIKPQVALEFYDKALSDLKKGKFTVDSVEYEVPADINSFEELFTINYGQNGLTDDLSLDSNFILRNIPVSFVNDDYSECQIGVNIGNTTDKEINVTEGSITTLQFIYPKSIREYQVFDYPMIYLPGNVTFGTAYEDVVKMYGELDKCLDVDGFVLYDHNVKTYRIALNNEHNYIYFQFFDNNLVGIMWDYFDFTNISKKS